MPLLRASSPTTGYSSDPEVGPKKTRRESHINESVFGHPVEHSQDGILDARDQHHVRSDGISTPKAPARTAAYQQLFEYVLRIEWYDCRLRR